MRTASAVIGKSVPRLDSVSKATAEARYLDDLAFPHMLVGKLLRSPYPHARILRIDTEAAKRLPGVEGVITAADAPAGLTGWTVKDLQILARDKVRWLGEPVAAVAAVDAATAEEALSLITVEYEELPAVFDAEEAMQPGAPLVHEGLPSYAGYVPGAPLQSYSGNVAAYTYVHRGDTAAGFKEADYIFEDVFTTGRQGTCPLEPHGAIAVIDDSSAGRVTVWTSIQTPGLGRLGIAEMLQMPPSRLRLRWVSVGGGFGGKTEPEVEAAAILLARKTRRPVKLTLSRAEEFMVSTRNPARIWIKTGVKADGEIVAREVRGIFNVGAYGSLGCMVSEYCAELVAGPYRIPNVSATTFGVYTNNPRGGSVRGFGQPQIAFPGESQLDMIAEGLGIDPLELRLKNAVRDGDKTPSGRYLGNVSLRECLEATAERAQWHRQRSASTPGRGVGIGCSMGLYGGLPTGATVRLNEDGTATVITSVMDMGQGAYTTLGQIAAEELGLPLDSIIVTTGDTEFAPFDAGSFADRVTFHCGMAVHEACAQVREQVLRFGAELLQASPDELELAQGFVRARDNPERAVPLAAVPGYAQFVRDHLIVGNGVGGGQRPVDPENLEGSSYPPTSSNSFAAAIAEVEVDSDTGVVKILKISEAADCGRAINPMGVEGQTEGCVGFSASTALLEELLVEEGRVTNGQFSDYLIPFAADTPPIETVIVEVPEEGGPFGAKGLSDPHPGAVVAAVANAIYHATGARLYDLPFTPERVLAALPKD